MTLADETDRQQISEATSKTLFVNAGAGSGKTKHLVDRVRHLVLDDGVRLRNIAAVTFTEKAGAELRDRLRAEFETARRGAGGSDPGAEDALADLDTAAIGTLHSFARRILTAYPIEAGLPPLVEVLDEVGSSVAFDDQWSVMQRRLLDDPTMADAVVRAINVSITLEQLRSLSRAFGYDWDLIATHVLHEQQPEFQEPEIVGVRDLAQALLDRRVECVKPDDKLLAQFEHLVAWLGRLDSCGTPEQRWLVLGQASELKRGNAGTKANWADAASIRADWDALKSAAAEGTVAIADAIVRPIAYWIAQQVQAAAYARKVEGRLEFHDLLVIARDLLRHSPEARAGLHEDYRHLLLDEFQDTDPIQIEIAHRIAGGREASAEHWQDIAVPDGRLFFVGDPKQSIYRFRRASIKSYLAVGDAALNSVTLRTNFRTTAPVLDWINKVFGQVIQEEPDRQPAYVPLVPHRTEAAEGPAVVLLGATEHLDAPKAELLRDREAADVAGIIARAVTETWRVYDKRGECWRPIALGDIAVLIPARSSLAALEEALETAGVPYRTEASSFVYQATEVRELMAATRTIADPTDHLSCVTALRSPLFGCGDDDLWAWKLAGRGFNIRALLPDDLDPDDPVGRAMHYLQSLHRQSTWLVPSELLARILADRRMLEVAATGDRARDQWRRLRFVVDQARAWSDTQHGGLRAYLAWASRQADESARVAEAVLPETDVDAVRVMTIHAAKGLEFPMVVMSGMTSAPNNRPGVRLIWTDGGYVVRLKQGLQTNDFSAQQPLDEQMDALEKRRLLYVAATRARDHLVVSLHHGGRQVKSSARLLRDVAVATGAEQANPSGPPAQGLRSPAPPPPPDWDEWLRTVTEARARSAVPSATSASGREGTDPPPEQHPKAEPAPPPGAAKGARDVELPPWSKGRYGSAIGRAVHAVLQSVDLAAGSDLAQHVAVQCAAEGVTPYAKLVTALAQSALDSDIVRRAAAREHWRETYAGQKRSDGTVLEGIIDLIYREDDGSLVIVDYKTDDVPDAAIPLRADFYRPQVGAYRELVVSDVQTDVVRTVLLFLRPSTPALTVEIERRTPTKEAIT